MFDDYMTWDALLAEIAKIKGKPVSRRTIQRWQDKDGFPKTMPTPIGRLFVKKQISQWLKAQEKLIPLDKFVGT